MHSCFFCGKILFPQHETFGNVAKNVNIVTQLFRGRDQKEWLEIKVATPKKHFLRVK